MNVYPRIRIVTNGKRYRVERKIGTEPDRWAPVMDFKRTSRVLDRARVTGGMPLFVHVPFETRFLFLAKRRKRIEEAKGFSESDKNTEWTEVDT